MDTTMFFDGWHGMVRVLVLGLLGYTALILMLRLSRKRTLAQMNVFDFVYIVVMGELLGMTILAEHVSLAEGLFALAVLILAQALISWVVTRSKTLEHVINGEPTLLFHRGRFLRDTMRAQRVTESEVLAAVREHGVADLGEVEAVVLETNGAFSVIHFGVPSRASALRDVPEAPEGSRGAGRASRDAAYAGTASR